MILHLLNYDRMVPAENVRVRLDLHGLVEDLSRRDCGSVRRTQPRLS